MLIMDNHSKINLWLRQQWNVQSNWRSSSSSLLSVSTVVHLRGKSCLQADTCLPLRHLNLLNRKSANHHHMAFNQALGNTEPHSYFCLSIKTLAGTLILICDMRGHQTPFRSSKTDACLCCSIFSFTANIEGRARFDTPLISFLQHRHKTCKMLVALWLAVNIKKQ